LQFDVSLNKNNPVFTPSKLDFLQTHHAHNLILARGNGYRNILGSAVDAVKAQFTNADLEEAGISNHADLCSRVDAVLMINSKNWTNPQAFATSHWYLFALLQKNQNGQIASNRGRKRDPPFRLLEEVIPNICTTISTEMLTALSIDKPFNRDVLSDAIQRAREKVLHQLDSPVLEHQPLKKVANLTTSYYLRLWLTGGSSGPGVVDTMLLLGREVSMRRIIDAQKDDDIDLLDEASTAIEDQRIASESR
jgi:glutamyl-tRNA synthetase